ncbi:MAG: CapA family protein [Synergistaceae bacterium]|nr:CapA family protein [Synergistaceae bacterium]
MFFTKVKALLACSILAVIFASPAECGAPERARLVFIGDIMAHAEQLEAARVCGSWDFKPQFRRVKPLFWDAFVVGNLETVFAGEERKFTGYPMFNTPDELAPALSDLGLGLATLATNHIFDRKSAGAARTAEVLEDHGIAWTGLSVGEAASDEPKVVEYAGFRFAFINYAYGSNTPLPTSSDAKAARLNVISADAIKEVLSRARAVSPDIVVACYHWGNEYQFAPTKRQRDIAELSVREGADLVIGTHPHVLQPMEIVSSDRGYGLVAYSLGNFVSYQRTLPRERSAVLAVDIERADGGGARISCVSVAPTRVSNRKLSGRRRVEVVYAGKGGRFNHAGLPTDELNDARRAGVAVLEFLGAGDMPDEDGFYILWSSDAPDVMPSGKRKSPQ